MQNWSHKIQNSCSLNANNTIGLFKMAIICVSAQVLLTVFKSHLYGFLGGKKSLENAQKLPRKCLEPCGKVKLSYSAY